MTISSQPVRHSRDCAGATTGPFIFPHRFLAATDLVVTRISAAGVRTLLHLGADYSVSGAGADGGGSVTTTAAYSDGRIELWLDIPIQQTTQYPPNDPFPSQSHEDALDRLTLIAAQQAVAIDDVAADMTELSSQMASMVAGFTGIGSGAAKVVTAHSYAFIAADRGVRISFTNLDGCICTLGPECGADFYVECGQDNGDDGDVISINATPVSGMTNVGLGGAFQSAGPGAEIVVMMVAGDGVTGAFKVTGQTA